MGNVIDQFAHEIGISIDDEDTQNQNQNLTQKAKKGLYNFIDCPHKNKDYALNQNLNISNLSSLFSCPDITKCDCLINTPLKHSKDRKEHASNGCPTSKVSTFQTDGTKDNFNEKNDKSEKSEKNEKNSPNIDAYKSPISFEARNKERELKSPFTNSVKLESPSIFLRFQIQNSCKKNLPKKIEDNF